MDGRGEVEGPEHEKVRQTCGTTTWRSRWTHCSISRSWRKCGPAQPQSSQPCEGVYETAASMVQGVATSLGGPGAAGVSLVMHR